MNHFSISASTFTKSLNLDELHNFSSEADISFRIEKGVRYMNMRFLLMCDWDVPPPGGVVDDHHTVASIQEVDNIMNQRVAAHPDEFWLGYKTPSGGAHAFLISHKVEVKEGIAILDELKVDKLYQQNCFKRNSFAVRITPKPNRLNDFVAQRWKTWGTGQPVPEIEEVLRKHDSFLEPNDRFYKI